MKKIASFFLIVSFIFASTSLTFANTKFNDNNTISSYAVDSIIWSVENSIVNGFEDNTFRPKIEMLESQWASIVIQYIQKDGIPKPLEGEKWFDPVYNIAQNYKLPLRGLKENDKKTQAITRGDVARTLAAIYGLNLTEAQAVEFMYENGFSGGMNSNYKDYETYGVNLSLTREQAVVFIHRINSIVEKEEGVYFRESFYPVTKGNYVGLKDGGLKFDLSKHGDIDWGRFNDRFLYSLIKGNVVIGERVVLEQNNMATENYEEIKSGDTLVGTFITHDNKDYYYFDIPRSAYLSVIAGGVSDVNYDKSLDIYMMQNWGITWDEFVLQSFDFTVDKEPGTTFINSATYYDGEGNPFQAISRILIEPGRYYINAHQNMFEDDLAWKDRHYFVYMVLEV